MNELLLTLAKDNPEATDYKIANKAVDLGVVKNRATVYNRLKRNDYLRAEIDTIRRAHREQWSREVYPLAVKRAKKALKDKRMDAKDVFPYVKLAVDKELTVEQTPTAQQIINIDQIQMLIQDGLGRARVSQDRNDGKA